MREPYVPEPAPEPDPYWDPHPARCPDCRTILQMKGDGQGWCPEHGTVTAKYFETQNFELEDDAS